MKIHERFRSFDIATDSSRILPRFQREFLRSRYQDWEIVELFVPRVFPRGDDGLVIQYRLILSNRKTENRETLVLCGSLLLDSPVMPDYVEKHPESVVVYKDLNLVVPVFPFDPKLGLLGCFSNSDTCLAYCNDLTSRLGFGGGKLTSVSCELLGYRLERRAVVRCVAQSNSSGKDGIRTQQFIARIVRLNKVRANYDALAFLNKHGFAKESVDRLTVPEPLCLDTEHGIYFMEAVDGRVLNDLFASKLFIDGCLQAALLLNKLHSVPANGWPQFTAKDELKGLGKLVSLVTDIFPDLASQGSQIFEILRAKESELPPVKQVCTIHRDYYDKQIIYSPERVTLLDLDNLSAGDPAQDLGNFIAHLTLRELQEPDNVADIVAGKEKFEDSYVSSDPEFFRRAVWWQAASLTRLAMLYSLRPRWRSIGPALLNEAAGLVSNLSTKKRKTYADKNQ